MYQNLGELIEALKNKLEINADSEINLLDESAFRKEIDRLVYEANFNPDEAIQSACQWIIREAGAALGILPASIQAFYELKGTGEMTDMSVPAINVRGITYDINRAIMRTAKRNNCGSFIIELAPTEMEYTNQTPQQYVTTAIGAAICEGYQGPLFIQLDHLRVNSEEKVERIKNFLKECVEAGIYNIDLDTSVLVDLSKPTVLEQQRKNFEMTAKMAVFIRSIEPEGINISIGGEIGEIGGKNSTEEELRAYLDGFREEINKISSRVKGISKVAIQTGTTHGGLLLPDGSIAEVRLDFNTLHKLSIVAQEEYSLAGCVQHGASTLPSEAFDRFPQTRCSEVHLATEFQNMVYDDNLFPSELRSKIYAYLRRACSAEKKADQTDEQFIYKTRKKGFGPFKKEIWDIPQEIRDKISRKIEGKFNLIFEKLNIVNTYNTVIEQVDLLRIPTPIPLGLKMALVS